MRGIRRAATVGSIVVGVLMALLPVGAHTAKATGTPSISVTLGQPIIGGSGWTPGEEVSVSVNGGSPVSTTASDHGTVSFFAESAVAGTEIAMTQEGQPTKVLVVADIAARVDLTSESLTGTTTFDGELFGILLDGSSCQGTTNPDVDGGWTLTFSPPGEGSCDLTWETPIQVRATDADGDETLLFPRVPVVGAFLGSVDFVNGFYWPAETALEVTVGSDEPVAVMSSSVGTFFLEAPGGLIPGEEIRVTDGTVAKTLVVSSISPEFINPDTDTLSGTAEPGLLIRGTASSQHCYFREQVVGSGGNWTLDWTAPDSFLGTTCDLTHDSLVHLLAIDDDGDETTLSAGFPKVSVAERSVFGNFWPTGSSVEVAINGEVVGSATSDRGRLFSMAVPGVQPGDTIVATDGVTSKTLEFGFLDSAEADYGTNSIVGTTTPNATVEVHVNASTATCDPVNVSTTSNEAGAFSAAIPDNPDWGCLLEPGLGISVNVLDGDADRSMFYVETQQAVVGGASGGVVPVTSPVLSCATEVSFVDLSSLPDEALAAIGCLSDLEIVLGTGDGSFSPGDPVDRLQMALFLARMLEPLGVELPIATDHGFEDVGDLPRVTRDAINQLASLGITTGTSPTTFGDGEVTRWQMALFLTRVAELIGLEVDPSPPATFADTSDLPTTTRLAIDQLAALGVTNGTGPSTFDPDMTVPRWQMALFLVRMLEAAGVTLE